MIKSHDVIVYETFPSTLKRKAGVFKFLRVEERFRKRLRLRDGLVWTVGPAVEKKLRFKISLA